MTKRMLIDDTHPEETRVVVIDGNKLEDVEFESSSRKQIKGNIYLAKVIRIEPSLQAAFVDYGGNKHGFLAFGEIHPDYYNVSEKELAEVEKEVDDIIEAKKQSIKDRELERERLREARAAQAQQNEEKNKQSIVEKSEGIATDEEAETVENAEAMKEVETAEKAETTKEEIENKEASNENKSSDDKRRNKNRRYPRRSRTKTKEVSGKDVSNENTEVKEEKATKKESDAKNPELEKQKDENTKNSSRRLKKKTSKVKKDDKELKVLAESSGTKEATISAKYEVNKTPKNIDDESDASGFGNVDEDIDDDDEQEFNFELQKKLLIARKLFHRSKIQDVIKEGQIILVQVVKEERGNKGAALTTYLSLAGRYCVLMPNRIKSGGVSRKITNASDRKRLKTILKELPLNSDMSMIVRTAGEDKSKADIIRDYNYLIRSWNHIKTDSLKNKAPFLIHEEANLIKRALRDMYTKDISEVIVDGANAYKAAKDFIKILSPQSLKKIKTCRENDAPLFQRFQVESQLEKLHDTTVQLESGGYLVINPTEALVAIDVNSGRATKEKDLEETALKTNLEAVDEIARQLRLRNLAGLVVIDFIDMEDNANDNAVEKRMKEALKKDRSRVQVGKMSCFGLIEISRQRMHPSFFETSYEVCPHCIGKGIIRTVESCSVSILREIESEGIKNRYSSINVYVPINVAIYLLNQKRSVLSSLEAKYNMGIIISGDDNVKNISNVRIERTKQQKDRDDINSKDNNVDYREEIEEDDVYFDGNVEVRQNNGHGNDQRNNNRNRNNNRYDNRRKNYDKRNDNGKNDRRKNQENYENRRQSSNSDKKEKSSWWKKLIGG